METQTLDTASGDVALASAEPGDLLKQYGCGHIPFTGDVDAFYERHLDFDYVKEPSLLGSRDRFEAVARSVRDILSQRWMRTEETYRQEDPKRVYYLSMEFLIGRSLMNNVSNLLLAPLVDDVVRQENLDWHELLEQEPDAGLGNGGLGRLAACFIDSMATMQIPAMGYGLRYEYGIFKQTIEDGWQREQPDNWLRRPDPWEVARPHETVEVPLNCSVEMRGGRLQTVAGRPSCLIGIPYDRPVVGYRGKTVNTLRLWAAAAHDYFNFREFSGGDFVAALAETLGAESLTRVLYPDDSTSRGQALRFVQEYFLVACSLADVVRRFRQGKDDWNLLPEKVAIQLNDTHPTMSVPELMRILLDDAKLPWDQAWDLTQRTLGYTNHTLLPEALEKMARRVVRHVAAPPPGDHLRDQLAVVARRPIPLAGRRGEGPTHQPDRRGADRARAHGQSGDRRLAQHQRCGQDPFATAAHPTRSRTWPRCSPSDSATRPTASHRVAGS